MTPERTERIAFLLELRYPSKRLARRVRELSYRLREIGSWEMYRFVLKTFTGCFGDVCRAVDCLDW